jgi:glycerol-3-phosphate dehydrogenase (NAD(P)+)
MGPSFAVDVFAQVPTIVNLLQEDIELASEVAKLFNNYRFACVPSTDVIGGQITSALKNVLAVICGYVDNLSINTKAAIFCEGIKEIYNFVKIYGGKADTIVDFCGIGDIYLTCTDSKSRNFTLGLELQENDYDNTPSKLTNKTVEGYVTFPIIYDFIKKNNVKAPLFEEFYDLLYNNSVSKENFIAELFKKICSK